jgi:hypothetical protein
MFPHYVIVDEVLRLHWLRTEHGVTGKTLAQIRAAAAEIPNNRVGGHVETAYGWPYFRPDEVLPIASPAVLPPPAPDRFWKDLHVLYEKMFGEPWDRKE